MLPSTEVGFYGKLPSHGDFLRRRVSDAFIAAWDAWLQECLAATRATLGDAWLEIYLTSPAWRLACAPGVLGPKPLVGVMVPSVDRVGRYFHLALVAELPNGTDPVTAATKATAFFDAAEQLAIETLEADPVDFERFDEDVAGLRSELGPFDVAAVALDGSAGDVLKGDVPAQWHIPLATPPRPGDVLEQLLSRHLSALYEPLVLWWTSGSAIVEPSFLISKGLPEPSTFAALLDGSWASREWGRVTGQVTETAVRAADADLDELMPPRFRSAAASDVGRVRSVNQDSYLEDSDAGIWVVADGLGGHNHGEVASRMVCDALSDLMPTATFEEMITAAQERICGVNDQLVREAVRSPGGMFSGSTVVALLARRSRFAIIWAGDSRVYRLRKGQMEQLTRDHSLSETEALAEGQNPNAVTRAVGGEATLSLDVHRDRVHAGDRFLLCSDGLTRTVAEADIRTWLAHDYIREAVEGLIQATLNAGAPDNVTAIIVEAYV